MFVWSKNDAGGAVSSSREFWGATRKTRGGIRLVYGLTKSTLIPKHVFPGLNFASLNKYSSGI